MPKRVTKNQITPKKKPITPWGFTTREGGKINKFTFPQSESAYERMEKEVTNNQNWGKYPGPHPEGGRGSRAFTVVTLIPNYNFVRVHSLFFPSGKVWDSTLRDFRKIRDYEQEGK